MPWTQADVDKLKADIALLQSVEGTTFADQSTKFRSLTDMLNLLTVMEADVAANATDTPVRTRYAATSKGV